jgi:hypothetical protein
VLYFEGGRGGRKRHFVSTTAVLARELHRQASYSPEAALRFMGLGFRV